MAQTDRKKIEEALRSQGMDVNALPNAINENSAKSLVDRGIAEPVGDVKLGDQRNFHPNDPIENSSR